MTRLHAAIEKEKIENIPISVSSGWATKQHNNEMMESIFKLAEDMMYHNKSSDNKSQRHQTIQIIMKTLFEKNPREEARVIIANEAGKQFDSKVVDIFLKKVMYLNDTGLEQATI